MAHATLAAVRDLLPLIAQHADAAERERQRARPVVDALVNAGVFRLLVPSALGGAGATPLEWCDVVETVSAVDGSTGWCVMISGCYGHFAGLLPPPDGVCWQPARPPHRCALVRRGSGARGRGESRPPGERPSRAWGAGQAGRPPQQRKGGQGATWFCAFTNPCIFVAHTSSDF